MTAPRIAKLAALEEIGRRFPAPGSRPGSAMSRPAVTSSGTSGSFEASAADAPPDTVGQSDREALPVFLRGSGPRAPWQPIGNDEPRLTTVSMVELVGLAAFVGAILFCLGYFLGFRAHA